MFKSIAYNDHFGYPVYCEDTFKPLTQKAKSIINGINLFEKLDLNKYVPLRESSSLKLTYSKLTELIQNKNDIENLPEKLWQLKLPIFARPCPLTPRHGFVDSRVITSKQELESLLDEVKSADPKGEVILAAFVQADYNAVLCSNGYLSVGPGHDGATAGINSVCFPVAPAKLSQEVKLKSGLSSKSTVFIEAVFLKSAKRIHDEDYVYSTNKTFYITQLRGGPKVDATNDFIPERMDIKNIVVPHNDLLKWETDVKKFKAGTVVYGKGYTLASHAAIHCVINKIPFITSFEPHIGQSIAPTNNEQVKFNRQQFLLGTTVGLFSKLSKRKMLNFSMAVLHNWAYLNTSEHGSWLLGVASVYLTKILCALSYGEYRHCQKKPLKFSGIKNSNSRNTIYKTIVDNGNFDLYIKNAYKLRKEFISSEKFRRGFGGSAWADAVKYAINIWNIVVSIQDVKKLTQAKINSLISAINKSVNLFHNNGWLFNKITESATMDKIATKPGLAALELADVFYDQYQRVQSTQTAKKLFKVQVSE